MKDGQKNKNSKVVPISPDIEMSSFTPTMWRDGESTTFKDVGGMEKFKEMARMKIILPFQKPELFKKFKKKIGGGILLYGPPGCGKTYLSRAIAGECKANFFNVGISDILDMWLGNSEKNIAELFEMARASRPALIFIDEIDALGRSRNLMRSSHMTPIINSFLAEMDGIDSDNDGILVIGATNAIWDVDSAFKRPGRFDETLFVPPPDEASREAILDIHLSGMPAHDIDTSKIAKNTVQFSGADLKSLIGKAGDRVIMEIVETGNERDITMKDITAALKSIKPSTSEWLHTARNYADFGNEDGQYDELKEYLDHAPQRKKRLLF